MAFSFTLVVGLKEIECSYKYKIAFSLVAFRSSSLDFLIFFNVCTSSMSSFSLYYDSILEQKSFKLSKTFNIFFSKISSFLIFIFFFHFFITVNIL